MPAPLVLHNRHTGERLELRRIIRDGRTCLSLQGSLPSHRQGPPRHIHLAELEEGRVVAGTLSADVDGQVLSLPAGKHATFPVGAAHRTAGGTTVTRCWSRTASFGRSSIWTSI